MLKTNTARCETNTMAQNPTGTKTTLFALMLLALPAILVLRAATASSEPALTAAHADRLVIRLINAETGEPMSHQNVQVEWDADAEESLVYVGGKGRGTMQLLPGSANFTLRPATKDYGDPNRLAYFSCSGPTIAIPVQQAIRTGFVAHNECNGRTAQASPGEIVFWTRPLPLWVPDFQ